LYCGIGIYPIYFECIPYKQNENISNFGRIIKDKNKNKYCGLK